MRLERSKEWWMKRIQEEGNAPIGAGGRPARIPRQPLRAFLRIRAKCAYLWRIGIIKRTTAFRWEMDDFLGEWTSR